ncbi:MAG: sulfurtransferase TusA family protein [Candidatus Helarchaeota archaeon]
MNADETLDVKGKTCPMPVLLTRKKIRTLNTGTVLEIIGNFQPAKINIQEFLRKEGHEILKVKEKQGIYTIYAKILK